MSTTERTATERLIIPPERLAGQGLDPHQEESGNRAIHALLTDSSHGETDWVATYRYRTDVDDEHLDGEYEVWALRGMIRFRRFLEDDRYGYEVVEQIGENPVANQDPTAVATIAEEMEAALASGYGSDDPNQSFMDPQALSYPHAYEKIAQLFDSPNAPDLVVNPKTWQFGRQPGQHGAADVVQARAPLVFSGPGIRREVQDERGATTDALCKQVDIAPTLAKLLGMPLIDGKDETGRTSSERGVEPDVFLKRQDGAVIDEIIDEGSKPDRVYLFLLDGLSNTELKRRLETDRESIPNLCRLIDGGLMFNFGTIVNFPSITWPSHNALGTGAWCGHHDIVNPTYYLRETKETVTPQGSIWETGRFLSDDVETLFEAVHRVYGEWDGSSGEVTASINEPCMRGAGHSTLERRMLMDGNRVTEVSKMHRGDTSPRWLEDGEQACRRASATDIHGIAQSLLLFTDESLPAPKFTYHEFSLTDSVGHDYGPHHPALMDALVETDKRIGKILGVLDDRDFFDSTLFVITTDHGMAPVDPDKAADQSLAVSGAGLKSVLTHPLVYLLDMHVTIEPSADGRTVSVTVAENDANANGDRQPTAGAKVNLVGAGGQVLATGVTDPFGTCGLPLPAAEDPAVFAMRVTHDDFNTRHIRLDGSNIVEDIRGRLYEREVS